MGEGRKPYKEEWQIYGADADWCKRSLGYRGIFLVGERKAEKLGMRGQELINRKISSCIFLLSDNDFFVFFG